MSVGRKKWDAYKQKKPDTNVRIANVLVYYVLGKNNNIYIKYILIYKDCMILEAKYLS